MCTLLAPRRVCPFTLCRGGPFVAWCVWRRLEVLWAAVRLSGAVHTAWLVCRAASSCCMVATAAPVSCCRMPGCLTHTGTAGCRWTSQVRAAAGLYPAHSCRSGCNVLGHASLLRMTAVQVPDQAHCQCGSASMPSWPTAVNTQCHLATPQHYVCARGVAALSAPTHCALLTE
jgi:hypothetical protein